SARTARNKSARNFGKGLTPSRETTLRNRPSIFRPRHALWTEPSSPVTSISDLMCFTAKKLPLFPVASREWRCARAPWWSIRLKAGARKTRGSCRTEILKNWVTKRHAFPRCRQPLLDEPLFREGGQCLACAEGDLQPDSESRKVFHGRALVSRRFLASPRCGCQQRRPAACSVFVGSGSGRGFFDCEMHQRGPRKCPASSRGDQLGYVGASESSFPRRDWL